MDELDSEKKINEMLDYALQVIIEFIHHNTDVKIDKKAFHADNKKVVEFPDGYRMYLSIVNKDHKLSYNLTEEYKKYASLQLNSALATYVLINDRLGNKLPMITCTANSTICIADKMDGKHIGIILEKINKTK